MVGVAVCLEREGDEYCLLVMSVVNDGCLTEWAYLVEDGVNRLCCFEVK